MRSTHALTVKTLSSGAGKTGSGFGEIIATGDVVTVMRQDLAQ